MSQAPLVLQPLAQLQVAAASALVCAGDLLYLLADDELLLQRYDLSGVFIDQQPLLAGSLPSAAKARKRLKPDFEMLCQLPDGALRALGSGSTAARRRAVTRPRETRPVSPPSTPPSPPAASSPSPGRAVLGIGAQQWADSGAGLRAIAPLTPGSALFG